EDADDEVEGLILEPSQIGRIAFLEPDVRKALRLGPPVPGLDEVAGDIDAQNVCAALRGGQSRRAIAASEIQDLEPALDPERANERLATLAHACGNTREVAFFPKGL